MAGNALLGGLRNQIGVPETLRNLMAIPETLGVAGANLFFDVGASGAEIVANPNRYVQGVLQAAMYDEQRLAQEYEQRRAERRAALPTLKPTSTTQDAQQRSLQAAMEATGADVVANTAMYKYPSETEAVAQYFNTPGVQAVMHGTEALGLPVLRGAGGLSKYIGKDIASKAGQLTVGEALMGIAAPQKVRATSIFAGEKAIQNLTASEGAVMTSHGRKTGPALAVALSQAKDMTRQKVSPAKIWEDTGFRKDVDKTWQFEIDDSTARYAPGPAGAGIPWTGTVGDALKHPDLAAAYPGINEVPFHAAYGEQGGAYTRPGLAGQEKIMVGLHAEDPRSSALHEVQHAVQNREGFDPGTNPQALRMNATPEYQESLNEWNIALSKTQYPVDSMLTRQGLASKQTLTEVYDSLGNQAKYLLDQGHDRADVRRMLKPLMGAEGQVQTPRSQYLSKLGETNARTVETRRDLRPEQRQADPPWSRKSRDTARSKLWTGAAPGVARSELPPRTGEQNAAFFSGKAKEASSEIPYEYQFGTSRYSPETQSYQEFTNIPDTKFSGHIFKMIPGFAEKQGMTAQAISRVLKPENVLDIGTSEGGLAKTVGRHSPGSKVVAIDPNLDMKANFDKTPDVPNVEHRTEAFIEGWDGVQAYKPDRKFDVVNEDFVFQFMNNDRAGQVAAVRDLMTDDGVFITSGKFHTRNKATNEAKKAQHQDQYFSKADQTKDKQEIISGMEKDMVRDDDYFAVLQDNFDHVAEYWNAGDFKGYIASNNPDKVNAMLREVGDLTSEFTDYGGLGGGKPISLTGKQGLPGTTTTTGVHYGKERVATLEGSRSGQGATGAEQARLANSGDPRIRNRVYFYVNKEGGLMRPEAGVDGGHVYQQKFSNVLDVTTPEGKKVVKRLGGEGGNDFESALVDAGYDGYTNPDRGMMVILDQDVPVNYMGERIEINKRKVPYQGLATDPVPHPDDVTTANLEQFMDAYGLPGAGKLSTIETIKSNGVSVEIPGGLKGEFSYADLMWLKANPIDASTLPRGMHVELQRKLSRATDPKRSDLGGGKVDTFNRFMFGMLSPNQPLTPNELEFSRLRTRSPKDIDKIASYIDWEPGAKVPVAKRKAANDKMAREFSTQARSKGGLGLKGSADYTHIAEFAKLYQKNPKFFTKAPDESWASFNERVMSQTRGVSSKVAAFSTVWQDPLEAAISAVDRHMARKFLPELFKTNKARRDWERGVKNRWNDLVDKRRKVDKRKDMSAEEREKAMKLLPKGPNPKKARNLDDVLAQQGGDAVFMDRVMSMMGEKTAKFRTVKGGINPNVPEDLAKTDWIIEPEKVGKMSDAYKKAQEFNDKLAREHGLGLFSSQWMEWDRLRRRIEPHEVMYPGLEKLPAQSKGRLAEARQAHIEGGYLNTAKKPYLNPDTGEMDMRMQPTRKMDPDKSLYWSNPAVTTVGAALATMVAGQGSD